MKKALSILLLSIVFFANGQQKDSTAVGFKKRVLETTEVDFLLSYYKQDGIHSAVSGGSGTENLTDITAAIVVAMPLSDDEVLTADIGISAYSSASSSNINPFDSNTPNPWQSSSGASQSDQLTSLALSYSASSDDRNTIWNAHVSGSVEYDYSSIGFGGGVTKEFNDKNVKEKEMSGIIRSIVKLNAADGATDDGSCLMEISNRITPLHERELKNGKQIKIIFEITDGASSFPGAAKEAVQELLSKNVEIYAFQMGKSNNTNERIFNFVWNEGYREPHGVMIGEQIERLPKELLKAVGKNMQSAFDNH